MKRELYYTIEVRDKNNHLMSLQRRKAHSFLKAYNQLLAVQIQSATIAIKDVDGNSQNISSHLYNFWTIEGAGDTTYGTRVGLGATAVSISDFKLEDAIDEGSGSGQLLHSVVTFTSPSVVGSTCSFEIRRTFTNSSGATITIKEIGIYSRMYVSAVEKRGCFIRDVLTSSVDVPDGGAVVVTYTIKATV